MKTIQTTIGIAIMVTATLSIAILTYWTATNL